MIAPNPSALRMCLAALLASPSCVFGGKAIPTEVPYGQDVEAWWASHPFNPTAPNYDPEISSPEPKVRLATGASIDGAIAKLPPEGGTLVLAPGRYAPFTILKRSNIHILAPEGATVTGTSRLKGTGLSYHDFAKALRVTKDPEALDDFSDRKTKNIYIRGLTFDGEASVPYALVSDCVTGVLVEDCTFRNYLRHPKFPNHLGMVSGCMGTDNIWYRGCRFECLDDSPPGNAVYHDGVHAGGLINCTIGPGFTSSGLLFLVNDDFTFDHEKDKEFEQNEVRRSEYIVVYGCTFEGGRNAVRLSGANSLVMNCRATGPYTGAFVFFNPKTSLIYPEETYTYYGNRVVGNSVDSAEVLAEFTTGEDYCPPKQNNKARVGKFQVRGNTIAGEGKIVRTDDAVEGENIIRDNSPAGGLSLFQCFGSLVFRETGDATFRSPRSPRKNASCIVATNAPHFAMIKTTTIRARIEPSLKTEVEAILCELGMTASEAIHLLYSQIKLRRGIPFAVEIPNALTAKTLRDSRAGKNVKTFATKSDLYADLGL